MEYCCFSYAWVGRGWTQEIRWLRQSAEELSQWRGRTWVDFLNYMDDRGWELVSTAPLGGGESSTYGIAAYFKRSRS